MTVLRRGPQGKVWGAVLVAATLTTMAACGGGQEPARNAGPRWQPTGPPDTTPIQVAGAPSSSLKLHGMVAGGQPQVPWVEGDLLRDGSHEVRLPEPQNEHAYVVVPYGSGALLQNWLTRITRSDSTGRVLGVARRAEGLGWSDRYHEVAWWDEANRELVLADSFTGREIKRFPAPVSMSYPRVAGWLGAGDVVVGLGRPTDPPRLWRPAREILIRTDGRASAVSPVDRLVAEAVPLSPTSDASCVAMVEADRPAAVLWRRCVLRGRTTYDGAPAAFSPDGRLLLVQGRSQTYGERPFAAVLDARTGDVKARIDQGRYGSDQVGAEYEEWQAVFEDDTHVLFVVADRVGQPVGRSRQAIVRCDVTTATCELASIPRLSTPHTARPYFLVG